ncbi:DUF4248 domain-containing protein [Rurimicrobium arvi]|uniref:DUF4248 domain-containing protein n=1 Tax=Rurimicrobium arvi TaxID=2049916 RepID=A0ABP8MYL2_9BACT
MFEIKAYTRKELAQLYFPEFNSRSAYMLFRKWLLEHKDKHPEFLEQLRFRHVFRKSDVEKIVEILGEP